MTYVLRLATALALLGLTFVGAWILCPAVLADTGLDLFPEVVALEALTTGHDEVGRRRAIERERDRLAGLGQRFETTGPLCREASPRKPATVCKEFAAVF